MSTMVRLRLPSTTEQSGQNRACSVHETGDNGVKVVDLRFEDIQTAGRHRRPEFDEERPQMGFDRQRMVRRGAKHDRKCNGTREAVIAVPVQERF